ncbi:nuclear transport factor 2 family protein [Lentzea flaviverrucosa]|uniref:SnoaL-like domain-containing protein n=1 Tax=Lentzea flaviverrucosa TaxID=200379 RepID=A0A1H9XWC5_9PSEU|nr:nuclear transport factor 2 family protein [Lentzea flaviverrucosa]RDI34413.1 SnoaL-like protein [Lentzea flaviverrucosa]SES50416.1 SnoaL-like domain-containing protein [Lentzea flaviverrucosa]
MTQHTDLPSDLLPATVREFFDAHIAHDADTASSFLTEDAVVVDQGETFRGREEVHAFLRDAGSEFEYTTEQIGARRVDDAHWVVTVWLEGTFPGGVAELDYRFALRDGLVAELVIANHSA